MIKNEITRNNSPEGVEDGDVVKVVHFHNVCLLPFFKQKVGKLFHLLIDDILHAGLAESKLLQGS
jgi:hypothetical protein